MEYVRSFAPGHVTGFFSIHDERPDPLAKGSKGAGFSLEKGVYTEISLGKTSETRFELNGRKIDNNPLTDRVLRHFFRESQIHEKNIDILQVSELPIGCGFGTSGAGALSLSLGLNVFFDSPLSSIKAAQIAHLAEIECKTGLGTVISETYGGFEIRTEPGAPGVGKLNKYPISDDITAVFLVFGPFSTPNVLNRNNLKEQINVWGESLRESLEKNPTPQHFLNLSHEFTMKSGLLTSPLIKALDCLDGINKLGAMLMFGEGIFTLVPQSEVAAVKESWKSFNKNATSFDLKIDPMGGRIVQSH